MTPSFVEPSKPIPIHGLPTKRKRTMRLSTWNEAKMAAEALLVFLGDHCPACGKRHTIACMDGGRCVYCMHSLCTLNGGLAQAVKEADQRL